MYHRFKLNHGVLLILDELITDTAIIFNEVVEQVIKQNYPEDVIALIVNLFDENDEINANGYDEEKLCKLAVIILNLRLFCFDDLELAVDEFNYEDLPLKIGVEKGVFYPSGLGNWYDQAEFTFIPRSEIEPFDSITNFGRI